MKYKLKELDINPNYFTFDKTPVDNCTLMNIKYKNEVLEFQTPKIFIDSLLKENNKEYISLQIIGTKACKIFCSKIYEIEDMLRKKFEIKSIMNDDHCVVKIPFQYSKPLVKVYKNNELFNYYHLKKGMEIICLLSLQKLWINTNNECQYNLQVKEIVVI
jgi:hypothetical protein